MKTTKECQHSGKRISEHFRQRKTTLSYRYGNPDTERVKLIHLPVLIIFYTFTASTQRPLTILETLKAFTKRTPINENTIFLKQ